MTYTDKHICKCTVFLGDISTRYSFHWCGCAWHKQAQPASQESIWPWAKSVPDPQQKTCCGRLRPDLVRSWPRVVSPSPRCWKALEPVNPPQLMSISHNHQESPQQSSHRAGCTPILMRGGWLDPIRLSNLLDGVSWNDLVWFKESAFADVLCMKLWNNDSWTGQMCMLSSWLARSLYFLSAFVAEQ